MALRFSFLPLIRKSVRNRLVAVFLLVILVPMAMAALADMYLHLTRMETELGSRNLEALREGQNTLLRLSRQAEVTARHLADMSEVRNGVAGDHLLEYLDDTRDIWFLGLVEIFDSTGKRVAIRYSGDDQALNYATQPSSRGVAQALNLISETDFYAVPKGLCIKSFVPVLARNTLDVRGVVVVTYPVAQAQLKALKDQVRADFAVRMPGIVPLTTTFVDTDGGAVTDGLVLPQPDSLAEAQSLGIHPGPGGSYALAVGPLKNNHDKPVATLAALTSDAPLRVGIRDTARLVLVAVGVALLLALVLGVLVANSFIRPILLLQRAFASVAQGKMDVRLELGGGEGLEDELGRLARGFNDMAERLESTRNAIAGALEIKESYARELETVNDKLTRFNQELEATVELRTREISLRNLSLTREVEERHRAENQLRESEQRFVDIIEFLPDATYVIDREGVVIAWNRAMEEITSVPASQVLGRGDHEYSQAFYGERRPALIDLMLRRDPELEGTFPSLSRVGNTLRAEITLPRHHGRDMHLWAIASPLFNTEGELIGAIESLRDVTERVKVQQKLAHHAFHDTLTGLANRALFLNRLEHAIRRTRRSKETRIAVLLLDLDRFKRINDTLGHLAGDALLSTVARRLEAVVRDVDTVARLGGDEFVILLDGFAAPRDAIHVATRILDDVAHPVRIDGHDIRTSASIGVVLARGEYDNTRDMLRDADIAMYRAKDQGRGRYKLFHPGLRNEAMRHLSLEAELRRGLDEQRFILHYQPIVNMSTGRLLGLEALLRFQHESRGLLLPAKFLATAEECGLLPELGEWVLRRSCEDMVALGFSGPDAPLLHVNISGRQFHQQDLSPRLLKIVADTGMQPSRLMLELLESDLLADQRGVSRTLDSLRSQGVRLALDDFGSGTTSLAALRLAQLDMLKMDEGFVTGLSSTGGDRYMVRALVALAQGLGLSLAAEGVEREEERLALIELGCVAGQGFQLARPATIEELKASGLFDQAIPFG